MMRKLLAQSAGVAFVTAAVLAVVSPPASADPTQSVSGTDITVVGSNTTQFLTDDLADETGQRPGYDATNPPNALDSWDTSGSTPITVKPGCVLTNRPNSFFGFSMLKAAHQLSTSGYPCVDVVRTIRAPRADDTDVNGLPLAFFPFAKEKLRYATAHPTSAFPDAPVSNAPQNLTADQLKLIFTCQASRWNDPRIGGTSSDIIQPELDGFASDGGDDLKVTFEQQIGITDSTIGNCVNDSAPQNQPGAIRTADVIAPFSDAQFKSLYSDSGIQVNTSGFGPVIPVYNVTNLDPVTIDIAPSLKPLLGDGSGSNGGWVCGDEAQKIVAQDGFIPWSGIGCGAVITN